MCKYTNYYLSSGLYIWFQLEEGEEDLYIVEIGDIDIGVRPESLIEEISESDWDCILGMGYSYNESGLGWSFVSTITEWAIRHGIAPYQPFCVKIDSPPYYSFDCTGECDINFAPWNFAKINKLTISEIVDNWERWFNKRKEYRNNAKKLMRKLLDLRQNDLNAMYLSVFSYYVNHYCVDEMFFPSGVGVKLCSRHNSIKDLNKFTYGSFLEGRSNEGKLDEAISKIIEKANIEFPHLSSKFIRNLPRVY